VIIVCTSGSWRGTGVTGGTSIPIVGIADNSLLGESAKTQAAQFSAMKSRGISSVRVDANWRLVQPTEASHFHWAALDQEVRSIRDAGMSVDLIIDGCPSWAAVPSAVNDMFAQPKSSAQYAAWAAEVVGRYRSMGVNYFEIWNEPNINEFWRPQPNPAAYTADLVAAYRSIKKVDPAAIVISGGLAPAADNGIDYNPVTFLADMYSDGAKGSFDYLGDHPYSYPVLPDTYNPGSAWSQMYETKPSIRSIMRENGDSAKKVWITEFGAPSTGRPGVSLTAQRNALAQALAYAYKTDWIAAFYIYTWRDTTTKPKASTSFGLESFAGQPKPALSAVSTALHHGTK
jgi:polysaccharide biosynthesis protein PslG